MGNNHKKKLYKNRNIKSNLLFAFQISHKKTRICRMKKNDRNILWIFYGKRSDAHFAKIHKIYESNGASDKLITVF